jgi:sec-independent protein translocase protein TatA
MQFAGFGIRNIVPLNVVIKGSTHMIEGLFQPMHLLIIAAVAIFFFGPQKLPELGKGLAEGIRNFKSGLKEGTSDDTKKQ